LAFMSEGLFELLAVEVYFAAGFFPFA
jgi:hypothetical protein